MTFELSIVKTSPTWRRFPEFCKVIESIAPSDKIVKFAVAFSPLPVNETKGILFALLNEYPLPLVTISLEVIGAPFPSIIPVILLSSKSPTAPELTFLPIGSVDALAPALVNFTICFLGNARTGLSGRTCVFKLPASIGVL